MVQKISNGTVYGNIKILNFAYKDKNGKYRYNCECLLCGNKFISLGTVVKTGRRESCGCLSRKRMIEANRKHGMHGTRIYNIWKGIRSRCRDDSYHASHRYKGRNITVCERWNEFINFYEDMKDGYFDGAELDRIDNDKGYYPNNCRWVTHKENSNNRTKYKNNTGYTGIHFGKTNRTYQANISHNRKTIYIGSYKTLKEAVIARKEFIINFNKENDTNYKYEEFQE